MGQRLAKAIAASGRASRREAERLIADGRVRVNDHLVTDPATDVEDMDEIRVDGHPLADAAPRVYYLLNKPRDYVTSRNDPEGRKSVLELVQGVQYRVEPVGRLDINTEGALLLTNDGELAHKLTHPSSQVPRRYLAKVYRTPSEKTLNRIRAGIKLEDGRTGPCKVRVVESTDTGNCWVEITVTEGRNRLVRRLFAAVGHPVSKLRRESFGTISVRNLERGQLRKLMPSEVERLYELAGGVKPGRAGHKSKYKKGFARPKPKKPRLGGKRKVTKRTTGKRRS